MALHVEVRGSGRDIVLLHGSPTDPGHMRPLAERLAARARTLLFHLPGYGRSLPLEPSSRQAIDGAIEAELRGHGVERAALVGMSGGSYRAAALALSGRLEVSAIAMLGPILHFDDEKKKALREFAEAVASGADLSAAMTELMLAPESRQAPRAIADVATWLPSITPGPLRADMESFCADSPDYRAPLAASGIPLLLRVGALDAATPPGLSRDMALRAPGARLEVVEGIGHALLAEDFENTAAAIESFFDEVGAI
jgi:3-oxoadipate enol-lactonase